jgi:hypothetical protein
MNGQNPSWLLIPFVLRIKIPQPYRGIEKLTFSTTYYWATEYRLVAKMAQPFSLFLEILPAVTWHFHP